MEHFTKDLPGIRAPFDTVFARAADYHAAANALSHQFEKRKATYRAPACSCALQAISLYLDGYLISRGMRPEVLQDLEHDFTGRAILADASGLTLRKSTRTHLEELTTNCKTKDNQVEQSEFMAQSQVKRILTTLDELASKCAPDHLLAQAS